MNNTFSRGLNLGTKSTKMTAPKIEAIRIQKALKLVQYAKSVKAVKICMKKDRLILTVPNGRIIIKNHPFKSCVEKYERQIVSGLYSDSEYFLARYIQDFFSDYCK